MNIDPVGEGRKLVVGRHTYKLSFRHSKGGENLKRERKKKRIRERKREKRALERERG